MNGQKIKKTEILKLYSENYDKVKFTLIKNFYYSQYQHLVDIDDVSEIVDHSFIEAIETYEEKKNDYSFFNHFFFIAKYKLLDTYRKYNYNNRRVMKDSLSERVIKNFQASEIYDEEMHLRYFQEDERAERLLKLKFLRHYLCHYVKNEINKKILYYKLKHFSSKEIAQIINIDLKEVKYRWNNLRARIKVSYLKWIQNLNQR